MDRSEPIGRSRRRALWTLAGLGTVGIAIVALLAAGLIPSLHAYYIPSEAMAPTLLKNDRILAASGAGAPFVRGEVILFRTGRGTTYIKRIAGLAGDRIGLAGGKVVLNGRLVPQLPLGMAKGGCTGPGEASAAQRMGEAFPGEAHRHEIYDCGPSFEDDFAEQRVAPGHLFVLGDNRDDSADSRVAPEFGGVAQVAIADVVGRAPVYTSAQGRKFFQRVQ